MRPLYLLVALIWTLAACCTFAGGPTIPDNVRVVDQNATGVPADGRSWPTAFRTMEDGFDAMAPDHPDDPVNQVWVAAGTFVPSVPLQPGDDRSRTFAFDGDLDGVAVYGGFLGTQHASGGESDRAERDPESNWTILAGTRPVDPSPGNLPACTADAGDCFSANGSPGCEIGECCDAVCMQDPFCCQTEWDAECALLALSTCNEYVPVYHVVHVDDGVTDATVISGFVITAGSADVQGEARGGGMLIAGGTPLITRCKFIDNVAMEGGGGLHVDFQGIEEPEDLPAIEVINCAFLSNVAGNGSASDNDAYAYGQLLLELLTGG